MTSSSSAFSSCSRLKATSADTSVPALLEFDAGRQQEQQRVEVVLLRHDAVLAQILRDDRRGNAVGLVGARLAVEAGRQQRQLGRIGDREAGLDLGEAVPGRARRQRPVARRRARADRSRGSPTARRAAAPSRARRRGSRSGRARTDRRTSAAPDRAPSPRIRAGPRAASCAVRCRAGSCRPTALRPSGPSSSARRRRARRTADRTARSRRAA